MDPAGWEGAPVVDGIVQVTGSTPATEVVIMPDETAAPYRVTGPLRDELRAVAGARIRATGALDEDRVTVEAYRVVSVDGRPTVSGTVEREGGRTWLRADDGRRIILHDPPTVFENGDRVWVEGDDIEALEVRGYGRIRPR